MISSLLRLSCFLRRLALNRTARVPLCAGFVLAALPTVRAQESARLTTLHSFSAADQVKPTGLVRGGDGNFYGTTFSDGTSGDGTVFRITPAGVVSTLHTFTGSGDGGHPSALALGGDGNFYGTTSESAYGPVGPIFSLGTVFQITPAGVLTTLYTFSGSDGADPIGGVTLGRDGNLYGTTELGGTGEGGTAFQITPAGMLTTLYNFSGDVVYEPVSLVTGTDGNFYGYFHGFGGDAAQGGVFSLTPQGQVGTPYYFDISEGADLVVGTDGNLYGYDGYIFQIAQPGTGDTFTNIYNPAGTGSNGVTFAPTLLAGGDGNLYGTSYADGLNGDGTLFQLTPAGVFTVLYNFSGGDGANPVAALVENPDGTFFGTTSTGGANGLGTFFQLTVTPQPAFFAGQTALNDGVYYLTLPDGNPFGYYSFLADPAYLYHFDLGYEYVFDAKDGQAGVYLYDFASGGFFYTSPAFPFPYLYDFNLQSVVYYFPDPANAGHYTTNPRSFYVFSTREIISK